MEITKKTANQWFKETIEEIKKTLPENYKMDLLALLPPEYDSYGGGAIINNVLNGRSTDMTVLEALKKLSNGK